MAAIAEIELHVPQIHIAPALPSSREDWMHRDWNPPHIPSYTIPPPGDFVAVIQQHSFLFDQDVVVVGTPGFAIEPPDQPVLELRALELEAREAAGSFSALDVVFSPSELSQFTVDTHDAVAGAGSVATASGGTLSGSWMNEEKLEDDDPELDDYLPEHLAKEGDASDIVKAPPSEVGQSDEIVIDASQTDTTMVIVTGQNLLVNEATLASAGVVATTIGLAGDYYCVDVVVQVNAIAVCADIDGGLPSGFTLSSAEDVLVNLAAFKTVTYDTAGKAAEANPGQMPDTWAVTTVDSDLISFNWLTQYNFMADGDSLTLTATGTTTTIGTGGNLTINSTGITYMGMSYDLLLIGGNLYDINYITQLNVLYDHDKISYQGEMPDNGGSIETGGNLLWNQAQIARIGTSDWESGVPDHYTDAMTRLDNGNMAMPRAFAEDPDFEGYSTLKVLYIKGDVYDINYVEQVNVAGDPDKVVLYAEETFKKAVDWSVQTGENVLINAASIVDYQSMGDTAYLGGTQYSQAMLIQAEIIHTGTEAPVQVVSEAVAFIADDFDADIMPDADVLGLAAIASQVPEGLDAVLA
ncbi:hypothetical protein [Pelagibacterium lacus]|uniref:hypothetical protein n=1 Tax=Pelagibacterium lacus TaxID=2282655 RepID=UPI0011C03E8A|nr:hypothetical protein [Pelagibacterium lacus]